MSTMKKFSQYCQFSVGDHVTRDGTDLHLVKDISADGLCATFVCFVPPKTRWCSVGDEEYNLCRRYTLTTKTPTA